MLSPSPRPGSRPAPRLPAPFRHERWPRARTLTHHKGGAGRVPAALLPPRARRGGPVVRRPAWLRDEPLATVLTGMAVVLDAGLLILAAVLLAAGRWPWA